MQRKITSIAAAIILGTLGFAGTAASAGTVSHISHGGHGHNSCSWRGHDYAGTISIDGCRTTIRSGRSAAWDIARAFRRAGYRASVRRGRVVVNFYSCRPRISWYSEGASASFRWQHRCVSIGLFDRSCGYSSCRPDHGHYGDDYGHHNRPRPRPRRPRHFYRRCW